MCFTAQVVSERFLLLISDIKQIHQMFENSSFTSQQWKYLAFFFFFFKLAKSPCTVSNLLGSYLHSAEEFLCGHQSNIKTTHSHR